MSVASPVPDVLVGRYQLLERLGEGGMGVVWRAFDLDLEEPIAIKFLREDLARDPELRACFRREVKLARRVTHANVARVFEFGRDGDLYFLTMEYVEGESLESRIERAAPLPLVEAAALASALSHGLAAAHGAGVVHGDIKPGNVLLEPRRGAVLTDFGIARVLSSADEGDMESAGTPIYMAPEQLWGGNSTFQSDVYAVGVVLFEALTGALPWPLTGIVELLEAKCYGSEPDLEALSPELPGPWRELLGACLGRDLNARPRDAQALHLQISSLRGALESSARSATPRPPALATRGPCWIEVASFSGDRGAPRSSEWIESDLVDALTQVRGLRVVSPSAVAARETSGLAREGARTRIRGEVRPVDDGVVVSVRVVDPDTPTPTVSFELHQRKTEIHNLGADLAARIVAAVAPAGAGSLKRPDDELDRETAMLYIEARRALLSWEAERALRLFEAARARAPGHRQIRLGHLKALVISTVMLREPSTTEIDGVAGMIDAAAGECDDLGEAHLAQAIIRAVRSDPVGCARSLRRALALAPSLVMAQTMLADLLIEIDRLPDASRHLEIALALDPGSAHVWSSRTRLFAAQGRWADFAASKERLDPRFGKLVFLRYCTWHPEPELLARVAEEFATDDPSTPAASLDQARAVLQILRGDGDGPALLRRLAADYRRQTLSRSALSFAQVLCELHAYTGDLTGAITWLRTADSILFVDRHWVERCPALDPIRGLPGFAEVRERVRARADEVAEAIWGAREE